MIGPFCLVLIFPLLILLDRFLGYILGCSPGLFTPGCRRPYAYPTHPLSSGVFYTVLLIYTFGIFTITWSRLLSKSFLSRSFVTKSAKFECPGLHLTASTCWYTLSLIQFSLMFMCLVRFSLAVSFAIAVAAWLSHTI